MSAETSEEKDGSTKIKIENPYKTFKDWVKSDSEGGRYISKEDETEVNGVPTTWYEVKYEKLTTPRHGIAFVYHAADIDYCATCEMLETAWKKQSGPIVGMLKSFKIFPRKGIVKRETTGEDRVVVSGDTSKMTPEERYKDRVAKFERKLKLATDRLTAGWVVKRSKNYVAIAHCDAKFTDLVLDQAEGIRAWADKNLDYFGDGMPGPEMIRICKDDAEESSFRNLSSRSASWVKEIVISRDDAAWGGLGHVAAEIFDAWLYDKNPDLAYSLPPWLGQGIREWVSNAIVRGGKLEFRQDVDTAVSLKLAAKNGTLMMPREMLQMTYDELFEKLKDPSPRGPDVRGFGYWTSPWQQTAGFVRYLLAGPGRTNANTKDLLHLYISNLDTINKERATEDKDNAGATKKAETEEEEDEQFKSRQSYWKQHEKDVLKAVFDKTFGTWSESDWNALQKSYRTWSS
jgi:hypothetical protein